MPRRTVITFSVKFRLGHEGVFCPFFRREDGISQHCRIALNGWVAMLAALLLSLHMGLDFFLSFCRFSRRPVSQGKPLIEVGAERYRDRVSGTSRKGLSRLKQGQPTTYVFMAVIESRVNQVTVTPQPGSTRGGV